MRRVLAILLLLTAGAAAHEASDALEAAAAGTQREALRALLDGAGHGCPAVSGVFMAGVDAAGARHWDVLCRGGLPHRITFAGDPDAPPLLRNCLSLEDGARCFEPADPRVPRLRSAAARCVAMCAMAGRDSVPACMDACLAAPREEEQPP